MKAEPPSSSLPPTVEPTAQGHFSATIQDDPLRSAVFPRVEGYRIIGKLGEGGMGTVWQAIQLSTRREVALKLMSERAFTSGHSAQRFQREVEVAAKLDHPNIAVIYEAGIQKGVYCYAMRLVRGVSLDQYVVSQKLDRPAILALMQIVCDAVGHAHERHILHRDLKPSNIMVDEKGRPFVLDFGLAKSLGEPEADVSTTHEGDVVGTPAYMSPEQAQGRVRDVDTRTDVYALGVMLYALLTGRHPVDLTGLRFEVLERIVRQEIKPLREASKDIDPKLDALVMKSLGKDRTTRYADARELAQAIKAYLSEKNSPTGSAGSNQTAASILPKGRLAALVMLVALSVLATVFIRRFVFNPDGDAERPTLPASPNTSSPTPARQATTVDLTRGLAAYWTFDDAAGMTAKDASGRGLHGTLKNMDESAWVTDKGQLPPVAGNRSALRFDGVDDRVSIPAITNSSSFSITMWIRREGRFHEQLGLLQGDGDKSGAVHLQLRPTQVVGLGVSRDSKGWFDTSSRTELSQGKAKDWMHVAVTFQDAGQSVRYYIGGKLDSEIVGAATSVPARLGPGEIGNWNPMGSTTGSRNRSFAGLIDDVRIYDRILNDAEIESLAGMAKGQL